MTKKNILLISQSLWIGGAEKVLSNLSLALEKNFNVYIITYSKSDIEYAHGGKRLDINCPGGDVSVIKKIKNFLVRVWQVRKYKKKWDIDISISFVPQTDYINILTKRHHEKVIVEVSSNMSIAFNKRLSRTIRNHVLKKANHVVAVSEGSMEDLASNFGIGRDKLSTIYNSCDVENIKCLCGENVYKEDVVIAVGSFRKPKGHWHLMKAFSLVANKFPSTKLMILGEGRYKEKYEELIENLDIDKNRIVFPGFQSNPYQYIAQAKVFVFSSIYEGFGNVIIESMACGTPVISTDCDYGPREILAPGTNVLDKASEIEFAEYGCLVPHMGDGDIDITNTITKEEKMLANAMDIYLSDEALREKYIAKGYKRSEEFDIKDFGKKWEELIFILTEK